MTEAIESFSLEAVVLGSFGGIAFATQALTDAHKLLPVGSRLRTVVAKLTGWLDRPLDAVHRSAHIFPWMLGALIISVIAPIYDMYTDVGWADDILKTGAGERAMGMSWPQLLQNSHERTVATLMHTAQTAIVLIVLWFYSVMWNWMLDATGRKGKIDASRSARWSFLGAFLFFVVAPVNWFLDYIGGHAELLMKLPDVTI